MRKISDERLGRIASSDTAHMGEAQAMARELQSLRSKPVGVVGEVAPFWLDLALQFDGHRIEALGVIRAIVRQIEEYATVRDILRQPLATLKAFLAKPPLSGEAVLAERLSALSLTEQEPVRQVTEIKMTPIAEGMPKRDEMRGEQTILTYNERVGTWDISFMEAGWDDFDAGFALGVSHWLDISEMWPGVTAQVSCLYASPQPKAVTEEMVERAARALHANSKGKHNHFLPFEDLSAQRILWLREDARAALTAALKEA